MLAGLLLVLWTWGYHHFASFGYMSCMTCHYNPGGSGPLSEYGRALWVTELSHRWYVPQRISDDRLGEQSDFFFGKAPRFFKPHLKIRSLGLVRAPNTARQSSQTYWMQRELGFANHWDSDDRWISVITWTYNDSWGQYRTSTSSALELNPRRQPQIWLKEFYLRTSVRENAWLLVGQMDKPFGIRDANHTLAQRRLARVTQYDQSLGGLLYVDLAKWELQVMAFQGNIHESNPKRLGGASVWAERKLSEKWRSGLSWLVQSNEELEQIALAVWNRFQLGKTATHTEIGWSNDYLRAQKREDPQIYALAQHFLRLGRGIFGLMELEASYNLNSRSGLGWAGFHGILNVIYRSEIRLGAVLPVWATSSQKPDGMIQTQWHLSW